jgi:hypothetical protein
MSLDLSRRDLFNGIDGAIVEVSLCFQDFFFYFFLSPISSKITSKREERKKQKKIKRPRGSLKL